MESDRLVDAVRLYPDVKRRAEGMVADYRRMVALEDRFDDEEQRKSMDDFQRRKFTGDLSKLYAALLAAEREDEAPEVGALLIQTLDVPESRLSLVQAALEASKHPPELGRWLDEAEAAGANVRSLRRRLAKAMEGSPVPAAGDEPR